MPRPVLSSERIELRPLTPEHLPLMRRLDADPEVMRYLTGRARTAAEADEFWAPRCADRIADAAGIGWWVGFRDGDFLGWWDLGRSDSEPDAGVRGPDAEIGWRLLRRHWRQGLATEGAELLLRHGFDVVGLDLVWAETMAVNAGSRGVMRKLGMRHTRTDVVAWDDPLPGSELGEVRYEISAADWRARQPGRTTG